MRCKNCGEKLSSKAETCQKCGTPREQKKKMSKKKLVTIIIASILIVAAIVTGVLVFLLQKKDKASDNPAVNPGAVDDGTIKNTVMIYFDGCDLEKKYACMSLNIKEAITCGIDTSKNKVLFYTGGCKKWHDFDIPSDKDCIYLVEDGKLTLLDERDPSSMASPRTLEYFMNYCVENYPAKSYSLLMSDHGGGPNDGVCLDTKTGEYMSVPDLSEVLTNVGFVGENKLETIMFDACLMASVEIAAVLKDHAKYMVASENISSVYGSDYNFLSVLNTAESGKDIGIAYVDHFYKLSEDTNWDGYTDITFSCIDLSAMDNVIEKFDAFFEEAEEDIETMYPTFSRSRAKSKKVCDVKEGVDATGEYLGLIDLYDFILQNKSSYKSEAQALLDAIDEAVVYNRSSSSKMKGLTFYLPFYNKVDSDYYHVSFSDSYSDYIKAFAQIQEGSDPFTVWGGKSLIPSVEGADEFYVSMQLTEEQVENFLYGEYYIFSKPKNIVKNGTPYKLEKDEYALVSSGYTGDLNNQTLEANIPNKACYVTTDDGDLLCPVYAEKDVEKIKYYTQVGLTYVPDIEGETEEEKLASLVYATENMRMDAGRLYLDITNDNVKLGDCYIIDNNGVFQRQVLPVDYYKEIEFTTFVKKKTFGSNSNLLPFRKWESLYNKQLKHVHSTENLLLKMKPLDNNADYYIMLVAHDIYGNEICSEIVPLNIN